MGTKALFVAATAQHVGKTTTCLGIFSGLRKRYASTGFMKPVGQRHLKLPDGGAVDKDVLLLRNYFDLQDPAPLMSPILIPSGFTRSYLDGQISLEEMRKQILESFYQLTEQHEFVLVEGTGHAGVGSIIDLSNADVAALLGLDVLLVTTGGIGSAFDQLALNYQLFKAAGVRVRAILVNKVHHQLREATVPYLQKATAKWGIPLVGAIPYCELLHAPTMCDYEQLFQTSLLSGLSHRYRHFLHERLVLSHEQCSLCQARQQELIITHASRDDLLQKVISNELQARKGHPEGDLQRGLLLTGHHPPNEELIDQLRQLEIPALYAPVGSYRAMEMITHFTAKIRGEDHHKVERAIRLVEEHLDFDLLSASSSHV